MAKKLFTIQNPFHISNDPLPNPFMHLPPLTNKPAFSIPFFSLIILRSAEW
jgi:hypothetical protein